MVYHLKEWVQGNHKVERKLGDDKGGTMRLGSYNASLLDGSRVATDLWHHPHRGTATATATKWTPSSAKPWKQKG